MCSLYCCCCKSRRKEPGRDFSPYFLKPVFQPCIIFARPSLLTSISVKRLTEPFGAPLPWLGRILLQVPGASGVCQDTLAYALANATGAELLIVDSAMLAELEAVALSGDRRTQATSVKTPQESKLQSSARDGDRANGSQAAGLEAPARTPTVAPATASASAAESVGLIGYLLSFFLSGGRQAFVMDILHKLCCEVQGPLVVAIRDVETTLCSSPERYLAFRDAFGGAASAMPVPATAAPAPAPAPALWQEAGVLTRGLAAVTSSMNADRGSEPSEAGVGQMSLGKGHQGRRGGQMVLVGMSRLDDGDTSLVGGGASGGGVRGDGGTPSVGVPAWDDIRGVGSEGGNATGVGDPSLFAGDAAAALGGAGTGGASVFGGVGRYPIRQLLSSLFSTRVRMGPPSSDSGAFASWQRRMREDEEGAARARVRATLQCMAAARNLELPPLLGRRTVDDCSVDAGVPGDRGGKERTGEMGNHRGNTGNTGNGSHGSRKGGVEATAGAMGGVSSEKGGEGGEGEGYGEEEEEDEEDILEAGCQLTSPQEWARVLTWALSHHLSACAPDPDVIPTTCIHARSRHVVDEGAARIQSHNAVDSTQLASSSAGDQAAMHAGTAEPHAAPIPAASPIASPASPMMQDLDLPNPVLLARGKAGVPPGSASLLPSCEPSSHEGHRKEGVSVEPPGSEGERSPPRKRPGTRPTVTGGSAEASVGNTGGAGIRPTANGSAGGTTLREGDPSTAHPYPHLAAGTGEVDAADRALLDGMGEAGGATSGQPAGQHRRRERDGAVKGTPGGALDGGVRGSGSGERADVGMEGEGGQQIGVAGGCNGNRTGVPRRRAIDDLATTRKHSSFQSARSSSLPQPPGHGAGRGPGDPFGLLDLDLVSNGNGGPKSSKGNGRGEDKRQGWEGSRGGANKLESSQMWDGAVPALLQVLRVLLHRAAPELVEGLSWDGSGGNPLWWQLAVRALRQPWAWPLRLLLRPFAEVDLWVAGSDDRGSGSGPKKAPMTKGANGADQAHTGGKTSQGVKANAKAIMAGPGHGDGAVPRGAWSGQHVGDRNADAIAYMGGEQANGKALQVAFPGITSGHGSSITTMVAVPLAPCRHVLKASELRYGLGMARSTGHSARTEVRTENSYERQLLPLVILGGGAGAGGPPHPVAGSGFAEVGSLEGAKATLREAVQLPLLYPELFARGALARHCKGVLLFGPPGTGKTMLARAVAAECGASFLPISMSHVSSKWVGDGVRIVRAAFSLAAKLSPCVIFVDEVDALLGRRDSSSEHEAAREVKNEFMAQWDGFLQRRGSAGSSNTANSPFGLFRPGGPNRGNIPSSSNGMHDNNNVLGGPAGGLFSSSSGPGAGAPSGGASPSMANASSEARVMVLAATNRPFDLDDAVLRRFTKRVFCPLPDRSGRHDILRVLLAEEKLAPDVSLGHLADVTEGYSGSDLRNLCAEAAMGPLRALVEGWDRDQRRRRERDAESGSNWKVRAGERSGSGRDGSGLDTTRLVSSRSDSALASATMGQVAARQRAAVTSAEANSRKGHEARLSRTVSVADASKKVAGTGSKGAGGAPSSSGGALVPSVNVSAAITSGATAAGVPRVGRQEEMAGVGRQEEKAGAEPQPWPLRRRPRPRAINAGDFVAALKKVPATVTAESTLLAELTRWNEMFGDAGNDRSGRPRLSYYM
eukprot:jgi/Mesvir1/12998/Mv06003-RA.2